MSKAEELALKAYPIKIAKREGYDENLRERKGFIKGYHQAEKDNELTRKDMKLIYEISCDVFNEQDGHFYNVSKIWEEVLKRFKERKEK